MMLIYQLLHVITLNMFYAVFSFLFDFLLVSRMLWQQNLNIAYLISHYGLNNYFVSLDKVKTFLVSYPFLAF
jgi:hypothetical protein